MGNVVPREQEQVPWGAAAVTVVGVCGWSGSGKTSLVERLVPLLRERGLVVGCVKHAHHGFTMDKPGSDSARHFEAGAHRVAVVGGGEWALRGRVDGLAKEAIPDWMQGCDLVLVEGFKSEPAWPKIEVKHDTPVVAANDPSLFALVGDSPDERAVPRFAWDDLDSLADLLQGTMTRRS